MIRFASLAFCLLVSAVAHAETFKITGQVTQPDGAVASGASVKFSASEIASRRASQDRHGFTGRFEFNDVAADYLSHLDYRSSVAMGNGVAW